MGVGVIAALAGAGALTQVAGGLQAKREAKVQEQIAGQQAAQARLAAEQTIEETRERAKERQRETARLRATQRVNFLKSGVAIEGTVVDVLGETERIGEEDVAAIQRSGLARAQEFRQQGRIFDLQGRSARLRGRAALTGAIGGALGSAVSGFTAAKGLSG